MAQCLILGGGGGTGSDDVTASKAQVLENFTAVTNDSDDDPIEGTMPDKSGWNANTTGNSRVTIPKGYHDGSGYIDGNGAYNKGVTDADARTNTNSENYKSGYNAAKVGTAGTGDVLSGKTFTNSSNVGATGTMPNKGAWTGETTGSGNVTIPAGYHNGSGYISGAGAYNKGVSDADGRANTNSTNYKSGYSAGINYADNRVNTSSTNYTSGYNAGISYADGRTNTGSANYQSGYNAAKVGTTIASHVLKGDTFTNNQSVGLTGTMEVASLTSFSIAAVVVKTITFKWKVPDNGTPYSGVIIRYSKSSYPSSINDGSLAFSGEGSSKTPGSYSTTIWEDTTGNLEGTTYYFSVWAYVTCSAGTRFGSNNVLVSELHTEATATTGSVLVWTEVSGDYNIPENASADVYIIGAGANGGNGGRQNYDSVAVWGGNGGGGGEVKVSTELPSGSTIRNVSIGKPGTNGEATSATINGTTITASGGLADGGGKGAYGESNNMNLSAGTLDGSAGSNGTLINGTYYGSSGGGGGASAANAGGGGSSPGMSGGSGAGNGGSYGTGSAATTYGSGGGGGSSHTGQSGSNAYAGGAGMRGAILVRLHYPKSIVFDSSTTITIPSSISLIRYCVVAGGKPGATGWAALGTWTADADGGYGGNGGEVKIGELAIGSVKTITIEVGTSGNDSSLSYNGSTIKSTSGNGGKGAGGGTAQSHGSGSGGSAGEDGTEFNGIFYGAGGSGGSGDASNGYSGTSHYGAGGAGGKTQGAAGCGGKGGNAKAFNGRYMYDGSTKYDRLSWESGSPGQPGIVIIEFLKVEA